MTKLDNVKNSKSFWLYNPKHGELIEDVSDRIKNELLQEFGGVWIIFEHKPTEIEIFYASIEHFYNYPNH